MSTRRLLGGTGPLGPLRIAQVAPLAESVPPKTYGGTERCVSWLTEALVELGHDVTLFASGDSVTTAKLVPCTPCGLRLAGIKDQIAYQLVALDKVHDMQAEFDIIHFHIDMIHFSLFKNSSAACLTTLHGRLDLTDYHPVYRAFPSMRLVSISDHQRSPMPRTVDWLATIPHGLPERARAERPGGDYLAFLGRIAPEKRPDRAIEIAIRAGMRLRIAAKIDPADRTYFKTTIRPMLDHPLIEFVGEIDEAEKADFLGNAFALLFPIDWPEPFGLVMIEALSVGTPVIAWRAGSVPEVIEDGVSGFIVDDMDEAVAAVGRIAGLDRSLVRARFEARFTAARMAAAYVDAYRSLGTRIRRPLEVAFPKAVPVETMDGAFVGPRSAAPLVSLA